jgi:hypothetical protein
MRPLLGVLALLVALPAHAAPPGWSKADPLEVGAHLGMWGGGYVAPGIGGHLAWRPLRRWGVQGFWNSFAMVADGALRHDHVIGFSSYEPLIGGGRAFLAPTAGLCVDFRFANPIGRDAPMAQDIRFGVHAGLMGQVYLVRNLTAELDATAYGYWGNDSKLEAWSATASNTLTFSPVGELTAAIAYHF